MAQLKQTEQNAQIIGSETISTLYADLLDSQPKLVTDYVPEKQSGIEQKASFLAGDVRNPHHVYDRLERDYDKKAEDITVKGQKILGRSDLDPKHTVVYEEFIKRYQKQNELMRLARDFSHATDESERAQLKADYMLLNIELYGAPVESIYRSIMQEKLSRIDQKQLTGNALQVRNELFEMVGYRAGGESVERFSPSEETVEWMHGVAESLYGRMLARIPYLNIFSVEDVQSIFSEIITQEFGDAAADWTVDVEAAKTINVKSTEKRIVIPEDRAKVSYQELRGLVVHEIGVHMMRAVTGSETDLYPLQNGLNEYYDAEEGLGVVMEQALKGRFSESGTEPYVTAGLAYHDNMDFRGAFEVKWRLAALASTTKTGEITDESITKAKDKAYSSVMRSMRGTDELPWFKDLAYYNGSIDVWRHLENIKGDDLKFMFMLLGKTNPANAAHERILLETKSTN